MQVASGIERRPYLALLGSRAASGSESCAGEVSVVGVLRERQESERELYAETDFSRKHRAADQCLDAPDAIRECIWMDAQPSCGGFAIQGGGKEGIQRLQVA